MVQDLNAWTQNFIKGLDSQASAIDSQFAAANKAPVMPAPPNNQAIIANLIRSGAANNSVKATQQGGGQGFWSRVLDVVSRPAYAVKNYTKANIAQGEAGNTPEVLNALGISLPQLPQEVKAASQILDKGHENDTKEQKVKHLQDTGRSTLGSFVAKGTDPSDTWNAIGRGLTGQDKTTGAELLNDISPASSQEDLLARSKSAKDTPFSSVLDFVNQLTGVAPKGVAKYEANTPANDLIRGGGGFVIDVGADPLTYAGPGAIGAVADGVKFAKTGKSAATRAADEVAQQLKDHATVSSQLIEGMKAATPNKSLVNIDEAGSNAKAYANYADNELDPSKLGTSNLVDTSGMVPGQVPGMVPGKISQPGPGSLLNASINAKVSPGFQATELSDKLSAKLLSDARAAGPVDGMVPGMVPGKVPDIAPGKITNFKNDGKAVYGDAPTGSGKQPTFDASGKVIAETPAARAAAALDINKHSLLMGMPPVRAASPEAKAITASRIEEETNAATAHIASGEATPPVKPTVTPEDAPIVEQAAQRAVDAPDKIYTDKMQADNLAQFTAQASKEAKAKGLSSDTRQVFMQERTVQLLRQTEDAAIAAGSVSKTGLFLSDVLTAHPNLVALSRVTQFAKHQGNLEGLMYPSQMLAGAQKAYDLAGEAGRVYSAASKNEMIREAISAATHGQKPVKPAILEQFTKEIQDGIFFVKNASRKRLAAVQTKIAADGAILGGEAAQRLRSISTDSRVTLGDAAREITGVGKNIEREAKSRGMNPAAAQVAAVHASDEAVKAGLAGDDLRGAQAALRTADDRAAMGANAGSRVRQRFNNEANATIRSIDSIAERTLAETGETLTIGLKSDMRNQGLVAKMFRPIGIKAQYLEGMPASWRDIFVQTKSAGQAMGHAFVNILGKANKTHTPEAIEQGFSAIKRGLTPVDAEALSARDLLMSAADLNWGLSRAGEKSESLLGLAWRNGATPEQVNEALRMGGITHQYDVELAKGDWLKMADQWKDWPVTDSLDFMAKYHKGMQVLVSRQAVAETFSKFGKSRLAMTPEEAKSWVKIKSPKIEAGYKTQVFPHIDQNLYYPREAAESLSQLETLLSKHTSYAHSTSGLGKMVNDFYDPVMQLWKLSNTTARPGHHIRNTLGDIAFNMLDGIYTMKPYVKAAAAMKAGGRFTGDIEGLKQLKFGDLSGGDILLTTHLKNGSIYKTTTDGTYKLAMDNGILVSYHVTDDVAEATGKSLANRLTHRINDTRYVKALGQVSEMESHGTRLAQFISLMERPKFTRQFVSLDEAAAAAVSRVRKFHPDVQGLKPFEQRVMRRIIPFYSWLRQAFPTILESMVMNPERITQVPKLTYAASIATGGDPQSLTDQFSLDKVYPSFIRDQETGPLGAGGSLGYNLGSPAETMSDLLGGNPLRNVAGMASPLLRAPVELATNTKLGTGGPISDKSDYIDSMIPGVNQVAQISAYSPSGTVAGVLGYGGAGVPDPQRAKELGNKDSFNNSSTYNFLLGLGLQNLQSPGNVKNGTRELGSGR